MARSIRKKIKETEKDLKKRFKKSGLSRREARRTARSTAKDVYESERQEKLAKNEANRQANRAAREAFFQKNRENEAMLKEQSRKAEEERLKQRPPQNQRPKSSNIATDLTKVSRGGIKGTASYNEQRKLYQDRVDQNQEAKRKAIESGAETFKTINPKTGEERNSRLKPKAKHGGALAIMIAPVKTKKMKAIKKAPGGASMKKTSMYKDGGKVTDPKKNKKIKDMSDKELLQMLKRQMESKINAASVDSLQRGRAELGKRMSSGLKLKDGGKVTDPKKGNKKISEMSDKELADMMKRNMEKHSRGDINAFSADSLKRGRAELMRRVSKQAAEMKKMQDGGSLKAVPSGNKGLSKLPKRVRNKMGYMDYGGAMKKAMKKAQNGGKVTDTDPKKKKKVAPAKTKKKTINANRTDLVTDYLNSLDKNSKEYKETIAYMDRMGIPRP